MFCFAFHCCSFFLSWFLSSFLPLLLLFLSFVFTASSSFFKLFSSLCSAVHIHIVSHPSLFFPSLPPTRPPLFPPSLLPSVTAKLALHRRAFIPLLFLISQSPSSPSLSSSSLLSSSDDDATASNASAARLTSFPSCCAASVLAAFFRPHCFSRCFSPEGVRKGGREGRVSLSACL